MAVLNKIRQRTGLMLIVVAGGLFLFLAGDLLRQVGSMFGEDPNYMGKIGNYVVGRGEYDEKVETLAIRYKKMYPQASDEQIRNQARIVAWQELVSQYGRNEMFKEMGIDVTRGVEGEESDMVYGETIGEGIKNHQWFKDSLGRFSQTQLNKILESLSEADLPEDNQNAPMQRMQKMMITDLLDAEFKNRFNTKFQAVVNKSSYVTTAEAMREYNNEKTSVDFEYVYVPFSAIADSTITVSDEQLKEYATRNQKKYASDAQSRSVDYLAFDIKPGAIDTTETFRKATEILERFKNSKNKLFFANQKSDFPEEPEMVGQDQLYKLNVGLRGDTVFAAGKTFGPVLEGNNYVIHAIADIVPDSSYDASHILIKYDKNNQASKEIARMRADSVLTQLKEGASFVSLVKKYSEDAGSVDKKGAYKDVNYGAFVAPFEQAVKYADTLGLIERLVDYADPQAGYNGFHIIQVDRMPAPNGKMKYAYVKIKKEIRAGKVSRDKVYGRALRYISDADGSYEKLKKAVEADSTVEFKSAFSINPTADRFDQFANARDLVMWAYNAELNEVKDKPSLKDDKYLVLALTDIIEKGGVDVQLRKAQLEKAVRNEVRGKQLSEKLTAALSGTDLEAAATKLNTEKENTAIFKAVTGQKLNSSYISGAGAEPEMLGFAAGLKADALSNVVIGKNGVFVVKGKSLKNDSETNPDLDGKKASLAARSSSAQNAEALLQRAIGIEDERYKFY